MQRLLGCLIIISFFIFACSIEQERSNDSRSSSEILEDYSDWKSIYAGMYSAEGAFYNERGRFIAFFPSEPKMNVQNIETDEGVMSMHSFIQSSEMSEALMVTYMDLPKGSNAEKGADALMQSALKRALLPVGSDCEEKIEQVQINGLAGLRFHACGQDACMVGKVCLLGDRLYQIAIVRNDGYPKEDFQKKFLDSFLILQDS